MYLIESYRSSPIAITYHVPVGYVKTREEAEKVCAEKNAKAISNHYSFTKLKSIIPTPTHIEVIKLTAEQMNHDVVTVVAKIIAEKYTPWFDALTDVPTIVGLYQVQAFNFTDRTYWSFWDGNEWREVCESLKAAHCSFSKSRIMYSADWNPKWRGLTNKGGIAP